MGGKRRGGVRLGALGREGRLECGGRGAWRGGARRGRVLSRRGGHGKGEAGGACGGDEADNE